jgi:hypothetical protein
MSDRRVVNALVLASTVLWFGGLARLLAEVATSAYRALFPSPPDSTTWFALVATVILFVALSPIMVRIARFSYEQHRADLAATYSAPAESVPSMEASIRRFSRPIVLAGAGSLAVAIILPSALAAATAIVVGLGLRVVAALPITRDIYRR